MKTTGIVRKIDELGRIVIPIEMRNTLGIEPGNGIEIHFENNTIILRKYEPTCVFCGETNGVFEFRGKKVCQSCKLELTLDK